MTPADIERAKQRAREIIDQLPQRPLVPEERIQRWIDTMASREPERLVWHAIRQSGFSGSEVGTLVANRRGQRAHFTSARKLVMQKLFMMTPDRPNENMLRGIETEDLHRVKFLKLWNAERDVEAYNILSNARGRYPFLRYSPDDVVKIQGHRILVDYKSPTEVEVEEEYALDYQCQINLGADIMNFHNIPASHGLLSRLSWRDWACKAVWVDIDFELQDEIADCAHHYWTNHVLRGEPPPFVGETIKAEFAEQERHSLRLLSAKVVALDEVINQLTSEREEVAESMKKIAANSKLAEPASVFAHDFKPVESLNLEHFRNVVAEAGLDPDEEVERIMVPDKYDIPKLVEFVSSLKENVDVSKFVVKKIPDLEKAIARLKELQLPHESVVDHGTDLRKSRKKLPDVNGFKPKFAAEGEELRKRLVNEALIGMGVAPDGAVPAVEVRVASSVDDDLNNEPDGSIEQLIM